MTTDHELTLDQLEKVSGGNPIMITFIISQLAAAGLFFGNQGGADTTPTNINAAIKAAANNPGMR